MTKFKKLFLFAVLLSTPFLAYGMDERKRKRNESSEQDIPEAKRTKNNDYEEDIFLISQIEKIKTNIQKNIELNRPETIIRFLLIPYAAQLTNEDRKDLYKAAELNEVQRSPEQIDSLDSQYEKFASKQKEEYQRAKKIVVILGAFYHLEDHDFPKALFTPQPYLYPQNKEPRPPIDNALEYLIMNEQEKISVCCFHTTLFNIARTLVKQNKKGIAVEIVTNQTQGNNVTLEALEHLINNNISVLAPQNHKYETNHHKFIIFHKNIDDKILVWAGSYNLTGNANQCEWNDVIIENHAKIIKKYKDRFEEIKKASNPIKDEILEQVKSNKPYHSSYKKNNVYESVLKKK